jgi:hypothetical protein
MSDHGRMQVEHSREQMWTLSEDRLSVRLQLPPLPIAGIPKSLDVFMDFRAGMIESMIQRLSELRVQMLPPPVRQ